MNYFCDCSSDRQLSSNGGKLAKMHVHVYVMNA